MTDKNKFTSVTIDQETLKGLRVKAEECNRPSVSDFLRNIANGKLEIKK